MPELRGGSRRRRTGVGVAGHLAASIRRVSRVCVARGWTSAYDCS
jgi:hypothetical protein